MTHRTRLDYADDRCRAWELAEMYAKLVKKHRLPLAVGVHPLRRAGGYEIYTVLESAPYTTETIPDPE